MNHQAYDFVHLKLSTCVCLHRESYKMIVNKMLTITSQCSDISKDGHLNNNSHKSIITISFYFNMLEYLRTNMYSYLQGYSQKLHK